MDKQNKNYKNKSKSNPKTPLSSAPSLLAEAAPAVIEAPKGKSKSSSDKKK